MASALSAFENALREDGVARALACGTPKDKVCRLFDLTPAALAEMALRTGDRISHYREKLQLASQLAERFVESLGPLALTNMEAILRDPQHKAHADLSWKVVERVLPTNTVSLGGNVGIAMSDETAVALAAAFAQVATHRAAQPDPPSLDSDPHMIDRGTINGSGPQ